MLAGQLDRKVTKDEILYRYLTTIYFGGGAYGIGAAAESYFHKPVNDLTLSESAILAGLISAPSDFDPRANPERAESNRRDVLDEMLDQKRIDQGQYAEARAQELFLVGSDGKRDARRRRPSNATLVQPLELQSSTQPYFVDYVRRYLVAKYGDDLVYRGGLKVETTLDPRLQGLAEAAVADALDGTDPPLEMAMVSVEPDHRLREGPGRGAGLQRSRRSTWPWAPAPRTTRRPAEGPICLAGGGTGRQPGSAFKPFTLAKAFEEGIGPSRVYSGPGTLHGPQLHRRPTARWATSRAAATAASPCGRPPSTR